MGIYKEQMEKMYGLNRAANSARFVTMAPLSLFLAATVCLNRAANSARFVTTGENEKVLAGEKGLNRAANSARFVTAGTGPVLATEVSSQ